MLRIARNLDASHVRSAMRMPELVPFDVDVYDITERAAGDEALRAQWLFEALAGTRASTLVCDRSSLC